MFKQKCFIRKNTPELVKKLEDIGYRVSFSARNGYGECLYTIGGTVFGGVYRDYDSRTGFIDCNDSEELFLAIAALRDDSDKFQWFVMDAEIYTEISEGDWFIATDIKGGKHVGTQIDPLYCHKATVQELIEHFNK